MSATADQNATALLRGFRTGTVDPVQSASRPVDAEAAMARAQASAARWRAGTLAGPLDGVPISVKGLLPAKGWPGCARRGR